MHASRRGIGFTLIELVVLITLLGMLAAFAVPKFVSLELTARTAMVESLGQSVRSSAALAHGLWLAHGGPATVPMEGNVVTIEHGYPLTDDIAKAMHDHPGFDYDGAGRFRKIGAPAPDNCSVVYTGSTAAGDTPEVAVDISGC
ncbi:MAG: hypothetical protein OES78_09490 [Chromatiales bacterium]|jgi:MSHA pilin protein MshA|nr:hypothetical protein [Chromatiales bacterium]MDH3894776.1 hypothetical protein [Chromatiales bacterium]MDH3931673.1 hypothetical protein [Chromatiales bacterium]MDH4012769.1 hypothetical protein [Chromatiales bacterium]PLX57141.1 MAG: type II secretory pathway, pseudopilin PulG [Chromatiales bacterium]